MTRDGGDVLVAAAGEIHQDDRIVRHGRRELGHVGQGVGAFEGRNDALCARAELERVERLVVGDADILGPADLV